MIGLERAANGAFIVGPGFKQISKCTELRTLGGDEVSLRQNDLIDRGGAESVSLLLGLKRLPLQFACFGGSLHTRAILFKCDVGVANVEQGRVLQLLHFHLDLALDELRALVVGLQGTIANRNGDADLRSIVWKVVVKHVPHGVDETGVGRGHGWGRFGVSREPHGSVLSA